MFDEIKLKLDPLDCEDTLAYDVDSFFETTLAIAQTAFNSEETQRGEHIYFVENYVSRINLVKTRLLDLYEIVPFER